MKSLHKSINRDPSILLTHQLGVETIRDHRILELSKGCGLASPERSSTDLVYYHERNSGGYRSLTSITHSLRRLNGFVFC